MFYGIKTDSELGISGILYVIFKYYELCTFAVLLSSYFTEVTKKRKNIYVNQSG